MRELSTEGFQVLTAYPWPGNVRELKNLIERIIILTSEAEEGSVITAAQILNHLQDDSFSVKMEEEVGISSSTHSDPVAPVGGRNLRDARQEFEKEFILKTLKEQDWNISKTAQVLGVERSHLHRKIKSYGIEG